MESMRMTQQEFATLLKLSPAALSGIFNERTKPTLNTIEAIRTNIPDISLDWLMFGNGEMYDRKADTLPSGGQADMFADGLMNGSKVDDVQSSPRTTAPVRTSTSASRDLFNRTERQAEIASQQPVPLKYLDKEQRKITEIRVFYDDLTYESFVPKK